MAVGMHLFNIGAATYAEHIEEDMKVEIYKPAGGHFSYRFQWSENHPGSK